MEKTMKARVQHKHDVEANWLKATNFIPLASEIIVYDPDENYDYPRIKIGDGETNINSLPFVTKDYAKISDIPTKPEDIGALPDSTVIPTVPTKISAFENDKGYLTQHQSLDAYAKTADLGVLATKDSLTASDVGALPDTTKIPSTLSDLTADSTHRTVTDTEKNTWNAKANASDIPTKVGDLTNDKGYITSYTETDPTVPAWAKQPEKPEYTAQEVGAVATVNGIHPDENGNVKITIPDSSQNLTLDTTLTQSGKAADAKAVGDALGELEDKIPTKPEDIGALPSTYTPPNQTAAQVGADPKGTAASAVSAHNTSTDSHGDLRLELKAINDRLTAFFDSDNQTLDELSEIVAYITSNKALIDSITTSKVSVADIINNLTTNVANKPLSAAQGVVLKGLIDAVSNSLSNYQPKGDYALASTIPTKVSQLQNDKGYLTEHQDISGKLDASKLPEAVNAALAQAKESGEFDGDPGSPGVTPHIGENGNWYIGSADTGVKAQGKDGTNGTSVTVKSVSESTADGGSNVVEFTDGKTLTVKNGSKGAKGDSGKTPVRGTDYWTDADQEATVQQVITALGTPVFGRVDADNNIILTGVLADGTYTLKYEDADGDTVDIGTLDVGVGRPIGVNLIPLSINADGTPYVGTNGEDGYKAGYRLNSAGAEAEQAGMFVTGFMPVETGDTISLNNVGWTANDGTYNYRSYLTLYDENFAKIGSTTADQFKASANSVNGLVSGGVFTQYDVGDGKASYNHLTKFKIDALGAKYLRMGGTLLSASSSIKILEL